MFAIVRELISNSYDADATEMRVAPLVQYSGILFWDDGCGLSEQSGIGDISPYEAFFSIGMSSKVRGEGIGYKCQGSKLIFASKRVLIITRCEGEKPWRWFKIDNPKINLSEKTDLGPESTMNPYGVLNDFFADAKNHTLTVLKEIERCFSSASGTLIVVDGLELASDDYSHHFSTDKTENSYLWNYIRFSTRHGDVRALTQKAGFKATSVKNVQALRTYREANLFLWTNGSKFRAVPFGFPYLQPPGASEDISNPQEVSSLESARFCARHAKIVEFKEQKYTLVCAIDGYRRALSEFKTLGRQRDRKSGLKFSDQRGTHLASQGVKICPYNELFEESVLSNDYSVLEDGAAQRHWFFVIDGDFDLVTNRNRISDGARTVLSDPQFLQKVKAFLDECRREPVFEQWLARLRKERGETKRDEFTKAFEENRQGLPGRTRFTTQDPVSNIKRFWIEPEAGEENLVLALYSAWYPKLSQSLPVPAILTASSAGLDCLGLKHKATILSKDHILGVEFKNQFSSKDVYNHPLLVTDWIIAWTIDCPMGSTIEDDFEFFGIIDDDSELAPVGVRITRIKSRDDQASDKEVRVLSLKELFKNTLFLLTNG